MLRQQMIDGQQIALALKEINLMRQIGAHANVVQFKGLTVRRTDPNDCLPLHFVRILLTVVI